ncbi:rhomboid protein [Anaeramoeba flamelloides]|uniref:Rhomboid protein n=1 Tax=Anaeramoeba flamelloides TaxID=1746091 RepID=A0AAV8A447_9EUKA|nr:rhomboid protein [Anaeramoeba flamelloides]
MRVNFFFLSPSFGFRHAPVSKIIFTLTLIITFILGFLGIPPEPLASTYQGVIHKKQIYRLFTGNLFFITLIDLFVGSGLLYHFRVIERILGTAKFAVLVTFVYTFSILSQLILMLLVPSINLIAPGPISLIFALLIVYTNQLPPTTTIFRGFGLRFNAKSLVWLFCVLLFVRSRKISVIGPLTGIVAGLIYEIELLPLKKLLFPESIQNFCSKCFIPMLGTNQSRQSFFSNANRNRNRNRNIQVLNNNQLNVNRQLGHTNMNTNRNQNQNHAQNQLLNNNQNNLSSTEEQLLQSIIERSRNEITNSTENISTQTEEFQNNLQELIGMGFDPEKAKDALRKTRNNLTLATNILLSGN